jgi:endoglucanase
MSLGRVRGVACVLLLTTLAACGSKPPVGPGGDDDGDDDQPPPPQIDADVPDADPSAPDAEIDADVPPPPPPDAGPPGCDGTGTRVPFASHPHGYASGVIKPSGSQSSLDRAVKDFYDVWKDRYVADGCGGGRYLIETGHADSRTVSEAHGYGMVIMAYMAGYDAHAKTVFDGMYKYYLAHQSASTPFLMAWSQNGSCANNNGPDSATDGDLDIAYALLLADKQWGSNGAINYHDAALKILNAILDADVDDSSKWILLGDWATPEENQYDSTRTSDFMPAHLVSFAAATGSSKWTTLLNAEYTMVSKLQQQYAPQTGLLPDFVVHPNNPQPAPGGFLEGPNDGRYGYNACRDPWRLGVHAIVSGDSRAKNALTKLNNWIKDETGEEPGLIRPGYALNGNVTGGNYADMCFTAPFGVAAMVSSANQDWLNAVWGAVVDQEPQGYYQDTVKLLSMIAMSGNWWVPEKISCE